MLDNEREVLAKSKPEVEFDREKSNTDGDHIVIERDEVIAAFEEDPEAVIADFIENPEDISHARDLISAFFEMVEVVDYKDEIAKMDGSLADAIIADIFGEGFDLDTVDSELESGEKIDDDNHEYFSPQDRSTDVDEDNAGKEVSSDADDDADDSESFESGSSSWDDYEPLND